jgi:hypothetical protein
LLFLVGAKSAVSTMLRLQEFPVTDASGAEQYGDGDLQKAVTAADVWGLDGACGELRGAIGHESKDVIMVAKEAEQGSSS